jgi:hypothetical protein
MTTGTSTATVDPAKVRIRAFFLWEGRTGIAWWDPVSNWLEAEDFEKRALADIFPVEQKSGEATMNSKKTTEDHSTPSIETKKAAVPAKIELNRYRLHARQPIAVNIIATQPFALSQSDFPKVLIRAVHEEPTEQMRLGGTDILIEFETKELDLLKVVKLGLELADSVLAALSLYATIPFGASTPIQLLETTPDLLTRRFMIPLHIATSRWDRPIDANAITFVQGAIAHWDNLDTGHRLRRAAKKYAQGLAEHDPTDAFQMAYVGLEVLEKPLAIEFGIAPGAEEMTGTCANCGTTFKYNRSTLAAVKRYVTDAAHDGHASEQRKKDWKNCSAIRNDLAHGLKDISEIEGRAHRFLPAIFHYLHDASVHLAHAHEQESNEFILALPKQFLLLGIVKEYVPPPLEELDILIEARPLRWVEDKTYGMLPEFEMKKTKSLDIGIAVCSLPKPMSDATEKDLEKVVLQGT